MDNNNLNRYLEWSVATLLHRGEVKGGDRHVVHARPNGALVAVIDGVGHGNNASDVADIAVNTLQNHAHESVTSLIQRCHRALRGSRGVVMSLAALDIQKNQITWLGVGNVEGILLRAFHDHTMPTSRMQFPDSRESVLLRGGILGYQLPSLRPVTTSVTAGDLLIFATDGIRSAFSQAVPQTSSTQQIADYILAEHGRGTDDALVLVARYKGGIDARSAE